MAKRTKRRAAHCAAISTVSLLASTAAHAVFIPGHIDPGGTGSVPGFTGNAVFDIAAGCLATDGWHFTFANGGSGGCGAAAVYSATIDLYTTSPLDPPDPGVVIGQFSLGEGPDFWRILGVLVAGGKVAGVDTDPMGPEPGTGAYASNTFWLQFVSGACEFGCTPPGGGGIGLQIDPAYISMDFVDNLSNPGTVIFGSPCTDPTSCVVSEPDTLPLMLGALGVGWLARRRKHRAAP